MRDIWIYRSCSRIQRDLAIRLTTRPQWVPKKIADDETNRIDLPDLTILADSTQENKNEYKKKEIAKYNLSVTVRCYQDFFYKYFPVHQETPNRGQSERYNYVNVREYRKTRSIYKDTPVVSKLWWNYWKAHTRTSTTKLYSTGNPNSSAMRPTSKFSPTFSQTPFCCSCSRTVSRRAQPWSPEEEARTTQQRQRDERILSEQGILLLSIPHVFCRAGNTRSNSSKFISGPLESRYQTD